LDENNNISKDQKVIEQDISSKLTVVDNNNNVSKATNEVLAENQSKSSCLINENNKLESLQQDILLQYEILEYGPEVLNNELKASENCAVIHDPEVLDQTFDENKTFETNSKTKRCLNQKKEINKVFVLNKKDSKDNMSDIVINGKTNILKHSETIIEELTSKSDLIESNQLPKKDNLLDNEILKNDCSKYLDQKATNHKIIEKESDYNASKPTVVDNNNNVSKATNEVLPENQSKSSISRNIEIKFTNTFEQSCLPMGKFFSKYLIFFCYLLL